MNEIELGINARVGIGLIGLGDGKIDQVHDGSICIIGRIGLRPRGIDHHDIDDWRALRAASLLRIQRRILLVVSLIAAAKRADISTVDIRMIILVRRILLIGILIGMTLVHLPGTVHMKDLSGAPLDDARYEATPVGIIEEGRVGTILLGTIGIDHGHPIGTRGAVLGIALPLSIGHLTREGGTVVD
jgi:hypothetical protein